MKIRHLIAALALTGALCAAHAEDLYLHVRTATGWEVLDLNKVDRLTFTGGKMTALDQNEKVVKSFERSDLDKMVVTESAGVEAVADATAEKTFVYDVQSRTITMSTEGDVEIFDAAGCRLVALPCVLKGETVVLTGLNPGIVIIKSGDYSLKTVVK